jgi:hypothetical protein
MENGSYACLATMKRKRIEKNIFGPTIAERPVRKSVHFPVNLKTADREYEGFIINISSKGLGLYISTSFPESTIDCDRGSILTLQMQSPFGETLELRCCIRWLRIRQMSDQEITTSMGMELINPPDGFVKLFNSLL